MSCLAGVSRFLCLPWPGGQPLWVSLFLKLVSGHPLASVPVSPVPGRSPMTVGRLITASQTDQRYQKLRAGRNLSMHLIPTTLC